MQVNYDKCLETILRTKVVWGTKTGGETNLGVAKGMKNTVAQKI